MRDELSKIHSKMDELQNLIVNTSRGVKKEQTNKYYRTASIHLLHSRNLFQLIPIMDYLEYAKQKVKEILDNEFEKNEYELEDGLII